MNFEDLTAEQYKLKENVQQFIENCKKAPIERRTSQFYTTKIKGLQELGDKYHKTHEKILRLQDVDKADAYFTAKVYETTQALIIDFIKRLETAALELESTATASNKANENLNSESKEITTNLRKLLRNQKALIIAINILVDEIMTQQPSNHPASYYSITATILESHMINLARNNADLWDFTEENEIDDYTLTTFYETSEKARKAMIVLQGHMPESTSHQTEHSESWSNGKSLKLPKISLPKFNGDYLQWEAFKDLYTEMVHKAPISDSQRIHYLTQALTEEPRNLIKHLPATGSNYAAAWMILTNRYDNQRLIVSSLLNKLLSQQVIKSESPSTIKTLHDVTQECLHGLKTQGLPVEHWDTIISHLLIKKMDSSTQLVFEQGIENNRRLVSQDEVLKFLERRFQSLEVRGITDKSAKRSYHDSSATKTCASVTKAEFKGTCQICKKEPHKAYFCKTFLNADLNQRWTWVKTLSLCVNCLGTGHRATECKSRHCTQCARNHHSLLHSAKVKQPEKGNGSGQVATPSTHQSGQPQDKTNCSQLSTKASLLTNHKDSNYALLGTASIIIDAANGQQLTCRAVLDSGSQINLITDRLLKRLGGRCKQASMNIEGVGANETKMHHRTTIQFRSTIGNFTAELDVHVIPKIVSDQPTYQLNTESWGIPQNIHLADPEFNTPGRIDCLLGAEIFFDLLTTGQMKLANHLPVLQNTVLGWVVAGNLESSSPAKATCGICTTHELEAAISKFWESEEIPNGSSSLTEDELLCESHFIQNTTRANDGRFIVKLPLKQHPSILADSKGMAYERFRAIERRLMNNPPLKEQYISFMREYEALGHMTRIHENEITAPNYFIPHHCVLRPDSTSTKLRVVFDASAHKASGPSLNDIMFTGPTVQSELFAILLRFRLHRYVLKTDVEKMYRQIWINKADRNLQLILWRENSNDSLKVFQLNTVTYGTRAAPYLATRCLTKLADEYEGRFPVGALALKRDFYVDDGLSGADSMYEALEIQRQLIEILQGAGMKLKKWCANTPKLLNGIAPEDQEVNLNFDSKEIQSTKTLGLLWLPKSDSFCIKANISNHHKITKRTLSSDLAHIYDPLGLIAPVVVTGKILLQKAWQLKLGWDEELPADLSKQWMSYREGLNVLNNTTIKRHIFNGQRHNTVEIHAFSDASERAFGAAVYLRTIQTDKTFTVNLLCSKSRVAPIKQQTIPRLELCAALLAAELVARVKLDLNYQNKAAYLWTDSQTVLLWINNHPGKLPVYVAHRINKILRLTVPDQWRHVPSKQNPADILSRGLKPEDFSSCNMWFYGPLFLYQPRSSWIAPFKRELLIEEESAVVAVTSSPSNEEHPWIYTIHSKNSFAHVQRVVGYMLRFTKNARRSKESRPNLVCLSPMELDAALKTIILQIQLSDFHDVRRSLIKDKFLPKTHNLSSLTPFLDENGIIRVGGRLKSSLLSFDARHQMLLPANDPLVKLLIEKIHKENYHCGPKSLLAQVRQRFWPIKCSSLMRAVVQRCVRCTKARPVMYNQIMGNLPEHRVQPARPFINSGVDYCGPFKVHFKVKGKKPQRAYLAVFCCFATKAVHLELVTDLTTEAFIGALKRFIARRGHCKTLYCDNATNFVGANNQLQELNEVIYAKSAKEAIIEHCSSKGIEFRFIPPRSPHFGGLWEAAVKSAKQLLLTKVAPASLTYEELETVIIEIEAILNSRPLIPSSSDANDLNAITPGHFLIGEELTSSVDIHAKDQRTTLLTHWQLVSQLKHSFWQRWSLDYLNELQQRHKWKKPVCNVEPNTMVILKEDNLPVLEWPLGRITQVHKGSDGFVRVCDVKTKSGTYRRSISRLAPLFPEDKDNGTMEEESMRSERPTHPQEATSSSPASLLISIPLKRIKNPEALGIEAVPKKRANLHPGLLFMILTLLLLPVALTSSVNVTTFNNKPGIYFERLGSVKPMTSNWNLVVYFDLEPYKLQLNAITIGTTTLQNLCKRSSDDTSCSVLVSYFQKLTEELQSELGLLSVKRVRRGAIDLVGNLANSLFGVLDSNYATQMSSTIDGLKKNDVHLEALVRNQTSLIDSTINIFKTSQLNAQEKFDEIDKRINYLMVYGKAPMDEIQIMQHILMLSMQMLSLSSQLQRVHSSILDVLIDSHHDKINPLLLTPQQLSEEIMKIKAYLPSQLQLPIHQNNLLEVYRLLTVNGIVAKNHIIFSIDLPLTDPREFQLLYLVPIAAAINGSLSAVKMSTEFLAISPHHDEFRPLTQRQLDNCLSLNDNEILCPNIQSTFHDSANTTKCEIDLFNNQAEPRCELYRLQDTTRWEQLHNPNQWVYATLNPIKLNTVCGEEAAQITLDACGLITLQPGCIIKNDVITVQGQQQFVTSLKTSITSFNLSVGWTKQYTSNNISTKSFTPSVHELEQIQQKLIQINSSTLPFEEANTKTTHSLFVSYAAISLVIIAVLITTYKFKSLSKKPEPRPIPAPRQHLSSINTDC